MQYLTEKEVSQITRLALSTLRNQRCAGAGIPYSKVGKAVRYAATDVQTFMESRKIVPIGNG